MSKLLEKYSNSPFSGIQNKIYTEGTILKTETTAKQKPIDSTNVVNNISEQGIILLRDYGTILSKHSNFGNIHVNPSKALYELFVKSSVKTPVDIKQISLTNIYTKSGISGLVPGLVNYFPNIDAVGFTNNMEFGKTQFVLKNIDTVPIMPNSIVKEGRNPNIMITTPLKIGVDVPSMTITPQKTIAVIVNMPPTPSKNAIPLGIANFFEDIYAKGFTLDASKGDTQYKFNMIPPYSDMTLTPFKIGRNVPLMSDTPEKPIQTPGILITVPKVGRDYVPMKETPEKKVASLGTMNAFSDINATGFTLNGEFGESNYIFDTIPKIIPIGSSPEKTTQKPGVMIDILKVGRDYVPMKETPQKTISELGISNVFPDINAKGFTINNDQGNSQFIISTIPNIVLMNPTPKKPTHDIKFMSNIPKMGRDYIPMKEPSEKSTQTIDIMPETPEKPIETIGDIIDIPKVGRDYVPMKETPEKTGIKLGETDFITDIPGYTKGFTKNSAFLTSSFGDASLQKSDKYPYNIDSTKAGKMGPADFLQEFTYNGKKFTQGFTLNADKTSLFNLNEIKITDYEHIKITKFPLIDKTYYSKYFLDAASTNYVTDLYMTSIDKVYDVEKLKKIYNSGDLGNIHTIVDDYNVITGIVINKRESDNKYGFQIGGLEKNTFYVGEEKLPTSDLKSFTFPLRVGVMAQYPYVMGTKVMDQMLGGIFKPFGINTGLNASDVLNLASEVFGGTNATELLTTVKIGGYSPFYTPKILSSKLSNSSRELTGIGQLGWTAAVNLTTTLFNGLFKKATGQLETLFEKMTNPAEYLKIIEGNLKNSVVRDEAEYILNKIPGVKNFTSYNSENISSWSGGGVDLETLKSLISDDTNGEILDRNKDLISQFTAGQNSYNEPEFGKKVADDTYVDDTVSFNKYESKLQTNSVNVNTAASITDMIDKFDINAVTKNGYSSLPLKKDDDSVEETKKRIGETTYSKIMNTKAQGKLLINRGFTEYTNLSENTSGSNYDPERGRSSVVDVIGMTDVIESDGDYESPDLINFYFEDISSESNRSKNIVIPFRAIITGFNDSVNSTWDSSRYMGRPDQIFKYQGFDRKIDLSFDIGIGSNSELLPTWRKINYLYGMCYPVNYGVSVAMKPPIMRLTVGSLLQRVYVLLNSVSYTFDNAKTVWETERNYQLPMFASINTSFTVIYDDTPFSRSKHIAQDSNWMKFITENEKTKEKESYNKDGKAETSTLSGAIKN